MDRGAWWAIVHGVAKSQTWSERLALSRFSGILLLWCLISVQNDIFYLHLIYRNPFDLKNIYIDLKVSHHAKLCDSLSCVYRWSAVFCESVSNRSKIISLQVPYWLARTSTTRSNGDGKTGHLWVVPNIKQNVANMSILKRAFCVCFIVCFLSFILFLLLLSFLPSSLIFPFSLLFLFSSSLSLPPLSFSFLLSLYQIKEHPLYF